ncbi:glycine cleavage system aminomethyltransferase GcvT [Salibacter sp.]|uniref:glycine cleavage system aminomethyltransferase GcvT n=1 Tax=Salibacter sp. TaxID=2010995 RepID=UPI00287013E3|nr:glycine cleavage system aminomethyltransferase GcvT [Salibacter sp.]MDR9397899.1 glycine cleavage system aminomethyltransferase GcvT [Salibacter sp.]MDR9486579.1 glycine cleavage system aminomethyltransferase GcvT [Salibacter sp.]
MKNIALTSKHEELGAKMVPFAGYNMPLQYTGLTDEHLNVRDNVGMFDVSHMGEFYVKGSKAFDLVQKVTSNDVAKLTDGKIQYTCMPNGKGGIVDDLLVYRISEAEYLMVVNASNIEKDWNWVSENNTMGAEMINASDEMSLLAVQGPNTNKVLQKITDVDLEKVSFYTFVIDKIGGVENVIISATGYTGEKGFELYCKNEDVEKLFDAIWEAGKDVDLKMAGLGARDTLRLEMGMALYGNDIDESTSPIEAKLGWITKFVDGNDFIDRELLAQHKENGVDRKLTAFEMIDKGIPRQGYKIIDAEGNELGEVTSGTMSPSLKKGIGLGYVKVPHHKRGTEIYIQVRKKQLKAEVVKLPFIKK